MVMGVVRIGVGVFSIIVSATSVRVWSIYDDRVMRVTRIGVGVGVFSVFVSATSVRVWIIYIDRVI